MACRLVSLEDDGKGGVTVTVSPLTRGGPAAAALGAQIERDGVDWESVEAGNPISALQLNHYLMADEPPQMSVRIVHMDGGEDDDNGEGEERGGGGGGGGGASAAKRRRTGGEESDGYFESYGDVGVHELMLRDKPRMKAYREAIMGQRELFEGKTVLDVGTGTGVLAMWCAKAGARKVYAVEGSDMAHVAKQLVAANKLEGVVEVIHGVMEQVSLPEKVDVIVSEWMGFYLLHESMLPSVLHARDKWLKKGGTMLPSEVTLWAAPCDTYAGLAEGLDVSLLRGFMDGGGGHAPRVVQLEEGMLMSAPAVLESWDCSDVTAEELVAVRAKANVAADRTGQVDGVCMWFDCAFKGGVVLKTGPGEDPTHWMQTVVMLGAAVEVEAGDVLPFEVLMKQDEANSRRYVVTVTT